MSLTEAEKDILSNNKDISDLTIYQDIRDTKAEIQEREEQIEKRKAFIAKLEYLLDIRLRAEDGQ